MVDTGAFEVVGFDVATKQGGLAVGGDNRKLEATIGAGEKTGQPGHAFGLKGDERVEPFGTQLGLYTGHAGMVFTRIKPVIGLCHGRGLPC